MSESIECFLCENKRTKTAPTLKIRTIASLSEGTWKEWKVPAAWSVACSVCALWMESTGIVRIERQELQQ